MLRCLRARNCEAFAERPSCEGRLAVQDALGVSGRVLNTGHSANTRSERLPTKLIHFSKLDTRGA